MPILTRTTYPDEDLRHPSKKAEQYKEDLGVGQTVLPPSKHTPWSQQARINRSGIIPRVSFEYLSYRENAYLTAKFLRSLGLKIIKPPIRSTAQGTWATCRRKFLFTERLALVPKGTWSSAREVGLSFHSFAEFVLNVGSVKGLDRHVGSRLSEYNTLLTKQADKATGLLPSGKTVADVVEQVRKDVLVAAAMVKASFHHCPVEKLLERYELVGTEVNLAIAVQKITRPIVGRLDVLLRHRETGKYWILDFKTTQSSAFAKAATYRLDFQSRLYRWLLHVVLQDEEQKKVGGIIHHVVRRPSIRITRKETVQEYVERVASWYSDRGLMDPNDPPIFQSVIPSLPGELLAEDLLLQIYELNRACSCHLNLALFNPNTDACFGPFGNSPCPYMKLCLAHSPKEWAPIIDQNFEQSERPDDWKNDLVERKNKCPSKL